jgi:hypothetical protein
MLEFELKIFIVLSIPFLFAYTVSYMCKCDLNKICVEEIFLFAKTILRIWLGKPYYLTSVLYIYVCVLECMW